MLTELQKKEKILLYKKELLISEVVKIDLEIEKIQKELDTYIKPEPASASEPAPAKQNKNDDILSLLRSTDEDDDFTFSLFSKPKKMENPPIIPIVPKKTTSFPKTAISNTLDNFTFLDITYDIKNIEEILIKVCEILISKFPYKIAYFTKDNQINNEDINFSFNELDIKSQKHRLSNGMWVKINNDSDDIINISDKLLEICG